MELSSQDLLKDAVFEENSDLRVLKISKATKKITDIIPFEKRAITLIDQTELPKYLILCIPLFGNSVSKKSLHYPLPLLPPPFLLLFLLFILLLLILLLLFFLLLSFSSSSSSFYSSSFSSPILPPPPSSSPILPPLPPLPPPPLPPLPSTPSPLLSLLSPHFLLFLLFLYFGSTFFSSSSSSCLFNGLPFSIFFIRLNTFFVPYSFVFLFRTNSL